MKLIDISNKIDKSKQNEDWVDLQRLAEQFGLYIDYQEQDRFKSYWVGKWCCTDTWVGYKLYFLDNEPVGYSEQNSRKSDENIKWFSKELVIKVREYLVSLINNEDDNLNIEICDINEDIGDSYKINYNDDVLDWSKATLNGENVKFIKRIRREKDYGIDQEVQIELNTGDQKVVNVYDLDFKFNLQD